VHKIRECACDTCRGFSEGTKRNRVLNSACILLPSRQLAAAAVRRILVRVISQQGVMKAAPFGPFLSKGSHANTEGPDYSLKPEFTSTVVRKSG
jgi:hypothetical protein